MSLNPAITAHIPADELLSLADTIDLPGEDEVEEIFDLVEGLVKIAKQVDESDAMEVEQDEDPDAQEEDEPVPPVPLKHAQAAAKDMQTFVFDNLGQFANPDQVQAAVNMLANSLNQLLVSITVQQTGILQFFRVLPRRIECREEVQEEQNVTAV